MDKKLIGGMSGVLIFSFFSMFAQNQDSLKRDTSFIFLQLKAIELESVQIVSATNKNQFQTYNPIALNTTANIDEVLARMPQVQMVKRGSFALNPQINSLSGGQITISIDGMRFFGACTDKMDPSTSYVEPINLKNAEVSCHSNASLSGSNVGGSLNLSTRKAKFSNKLKISGELNGALNSASLGKNLSGGLNIASKKIGLRVNGALRKHDNYRAGGGENVNYTQYQKQNLSINLRARFREKWILEGNYLFDEANDVGYAALPMDVAVARTNLAAVSITGYNIFKRVEKFQVKAYVNHVFHQMDDSKRPDEEVSMRMDMPGWSNTYGAFSKLDLKKIGKHNFQIKADYYYNYRRAEMTMYDPDGGADMFMLTWPSVVRNVFGIAAVDEWEMNKLSTISVSGRLDWATNRIEDEFGKRQLTGLGYTGNELYIHFPYAIAVGWDRRIGKKYIFSAALTSSSRLPTTSEMYGYYLFNKEDGFDYIGKPNIKTEKSLRTNLELKRKSKKLEMVFLAGYNKLFDFIYGVLNTNASAMTIGANGVKFFDNVAWAHIINSAIQVNYSPFNKWNISTRFNYNWGEKSDGNSLPQIQPLTNITGIKYYVKKYFVLLESESGASQNLIDPEFGEDNTASWAVLNIRVGQSFTIGKTNKLDFKAGVENVFDQYYYRHLDWENVPRMGRNFYLNLSWRF